MSLYLQVKAATGEEVSAEDLGGADLHCKYEKPVFFIACMGFQSHVSAFRELKNH